MELTNDVQILLPVMVAVMVAKWVGDFFTHPVYHALMEMKCIPFLDPEPRVTIEKKRYPFYSHYEKNGFFFCKLSIFVYA